MLLTSSVFCKAVDMTGAITGALANRNFHPIAPTTTTATTAMAIRFLWDLRLVKRAMS